METVTAIPKCDVSRPPLIAHASTLTAWKAQRHGPKTVMRASALLDQLALLPTKRANKSDLVFWSLFWPGNWEGEAEAPISTAVLPNGTLVTSACATQGGAWH